MNNYRRNYFSFGLGTIGRDMVYSLISMWLMFFLSDALDLTDSTLGWIVGSKRASIQAIAASMSPR